MVTDAENLALAILGDAERCRSRGERRQAARLARIMGDPAARETILSLTDEVLRVRKAGRAAALFSEIAATGWRSPGFGAFDRVSLWGAERLARRLPRVVVPLAAARVRSEMAGVVLPADAGRLARHAERRLSQGIRLNVNVLGEAVLGDGEAARRLDRVLATLADPSVEYVSVKVSSICAQLDVVAFDEEVDRVAGPLRRLYDAAAAHRPAKFVNLDMEEFRDLDLTVAVFRKVLDEDRYLATGAGIVLQAYLPDSLGAMEDLCAWARARHRRSGGWIKVRIVKGANLAMERVDAELHGWPSAPFASKADTDANYKAMLDVALQRDNDGAVRVGVATHNLFELSWAAVAASAAGALGRVEFEMLEGMSPAVSQVVARRLGGLLLYAPLVDRSDIESAIAYLVRRLDENSGPDNFITRQFAMAAGSPAWRAEADRFRRAVADRPDRRRGTRRTQDRAGEAVTVDPGGFANEPDTDFSLAVNRRWASGVLGEVDEGALGLYRPVVGGRPAAAGEQVAGVDPSRPGRVAYTWFSADDAAVEAALVHAEEGRAWADTGPDERRAALLGAAESLARRRGRLLTVMAVDAAKTVREGDPEVSEAIDFARYYAAHIPAPGGGFRPYGTVVVASPWNFPLSIPAGGVLAALAAGNSVILKPAPETVAVAAELAGALWEGGIPHSALQFVPCLDGDASRRLITDDRVDAVILTGAWDTAQRFLDWRPDLRLHAETSGKNAVVVTATADPDQAIADLVHSAFGHAGQKCSAASLAVIEAATFDDGRFLRRLADAVSSLRVGPAARPGTAVGPLIRPPEGALRDALTRLGPGERWLVEPRMLDRAGYSWSPGVKTGVEPGSPFHLTECFGPVLGVMRAADLVEATAWQNQPAYGLTAGLAALDPAEIGHWRDTVAAGNLYVNRTITGAVVGRQPFGGWKRSVVGPGAKAGGPNYVAALGTWPSRSTAGDTPAADFGGAWAAMSEPVDPSGLAAESNAFRYRPLARVALCGPGAHPGLLVEARRAAAAVGVEVVEVVDPAERLDVDKVRILGPLTDGQRRSAHRAGLWVDDTPVAADTGREVLRWVREQAVSESRHRHGNVTARRPGLGRSR